jgi:hypothetical protein
MITQIENLPQNVIGFIYSGKVTGNDYETVIFPAVEKAAKGKNKIRLLCQFSNDFSKLDLKAMMDDGFIGLKHFRDWERIAIISDHEMINHAIKAFSFLVPASLKIFALSNMDKAKEWITSNN